MSNIDLINEFFLSEAKKHVINDDLKILHYGVNCIAHKKDGITDVFYKIEDALKALLERGDGFYLSADFDGVYFKGGTSCCGTGFHSFVMPTNKLVELLLNNNT